jgi:hypothetical protein
LFAIPPQIGDRADFWVNDTLSNTYRQAAATLQVLTPDLYMWVEDGFQVRPEDLEASGRYFAEVTRPILHRVFGWEWFPGVDGDPRLHVFNGSVPNVGGYFYSQDEYPAAVMPRSNEREIFFVNLQSVSPGTDGYNALLAHEFQHMIQWRNDTDEEAWVNEGLSELATRLSGLPVYNHIVYLRSPDIALTDWPPRTANSGPHYGGNYLLMEYLLGRFGEDFLRELAQEPANGISGIERALQRKGAEFLPVFRDWTVANLLDNLSLDDDRYGYREIQIPPPDAAQLPSLPATISDTVQPFGVDYISVSTAGTVRVEFTGQPTVPLAPFDSAPGDYLWWSNRGDNKNTTLTRELDLTGVSDATLHASLWYALEDGWDFAHVGVSTDGGATWQILTGRHTQPAPPDSMALGPGYTGYSGSGSQPQWVDEAYSLAAFAGRKILFRVETVTDDAIHLDGLWIRSLEIPEIGWIDDGESSVGWDARGFVRVENAVPQQYLVTAVLHGPTPEVVLIEVGMDGRGGATLHAPEGLTLIVSAVTGYTRQPARYTLRIE